MPRALQVSTNNYMVPTAISVLLHLLLVVFVTWGWQSAPAPRQKVMPRYVEAKLVAIQPEAAKPKQAAKPQPNVIDLTARKRAQEEEAAKKRLAAEKAERERLRKLAEEKRKREAELEKQLQEKQRQEKQRQERERQQREAEEKRQRELERQRQQQAAIEDALAEEKELLMAEQSEASAQSYVAAMAARIEHNWSRPPSARLGMKCELRIQLVPTGDVVHVAVIKSSGNSAFDRSAEQAVHKVGRFEVLKDMPSDRFESYFRQVTLVFDPQDLRQ